MVGFDSIVGLNEVVQEYPYFQSAQMLLTKAFHSSENLNFENSLKKTAAYVANRQQLHSLLFSQAELLEKDVTEAVEEIPVPLPPQHQENREVLQQNEVIIKIDHTPIQPPSFLEETGAFTQKKQLPNEVTPAAELLPDLNHISEKEIVEDTTNHIEEKLTVLEEEKFSIDFSKIEKSDIDEYNPLENQILSSAVSNSILKNVSDEIPDINSLNTERLDKTTVRIIKTEEFKEENDPNLTINDAADRNSFTGWLKALDDPQPEFKDLNEEEEINQQKTSNITVFEDNREKVSFYSPVKMARLSVQEDDDLMTETLANIYADQEHFEKAIKAFKKLQLKYPEKSSYFAGRIKEIKIQLNI